MVHREIGTCHREWEHEGLFCYLYIHLVEGLLSPIVQRLCH